MEDFEEKLERLRELVRQAGNAEENQTMAYIAEVILPHTERLEKLATDFYEEIFTVNDQLKDDLEEFAQRSLGVVL